MYDTPLCAKINRLKSFRLFKEFSSPSNTTFAIIIEHDLAKIFSNDKDVNNTYKNTYLPLRAWMARSRFINRKIRVKLKREDRESNHYINYTFDQIIRTRATTNTISLYSTVVELIDPPTFDQGLLGQRSKIAVIIYPKKWWRHKPKEEGE